MLIHTTILTSLLGTFIYFSCYGEAFSLDSGVNKHLSHMGRFGAIDITNMPNHEIDYYDSAIIETDYGRVNSVFNVIEYGAEGDGVTDDSEAFQEAWTATCKLDNGTMVVPSGYTFLLQPIAFNGKKCKSNPTFKVIGKIVAPDMTKWENDNNQWIKFSGFSNGLTITGGGVFDGRGNKWWSSYNKLLSGSKQKKKKNESPHAIGIVLSNEVMVKGIKIQNSPQMHIFFTSCQHVTISNLSLKSPGESPNTDGIHLSHTEQVEISDSTLSCGDDCVSIQRGCSNVTIDNVVCGPGHGYSIGSLKGQGASISDIFVYNSKVVGTTNGLRIKTWMGAQGSLDNVRYENITMYNVTRPIIIDQDYCDGTDFCHSSEEENAVAISEVRYKNISGTYMNDLVVAVVCSEYVPCKRIWMSDIDLNPPTGHGKYVEDSLRCSNAYGKVIQPTNPPLEKCLLSG